MGKSYTAYFSSLLLFGSNGIVASCIALSSLDIVVARTFLGMSLLGCLFVVSLAFARRRHAHTGNCTTFDPAKPARPSESARSARFAANPPRFALGLLLYAASGAALGVSWIALFEAYTQIGVGTASLLYYVGPVLVMALAPILFKERLTAGKIAGFAAVCLGAVLVSAQSLEGGQNLFGLALGGVSAAAYSAMIVCAKCAVRVCPAAAQNGVRNAFVQLFAGFIVAASYSVITQGPQGLFIPLAPTDIAPLLMLGLLNTGIGCYFYFTSVGKLPVQTVAVCGYLEPLSAVALSALLLGEPLGAAQIAGAVLIVGGAAFCEVSGTLALKRTRIRHTQRTAKRNGASHSIPQRTQLS